MTSGFLTKRLSESEEALPFEDYDPAIKGIVLQAIRSAWKELVAHDPVEILGYNESKITACLERSLNDMRVETSIQILHLWLRLRSGEN